MDEENVNFEQAQMIINKIDDIRRFLKYMNNDEAEPAMNCFDRLLFDIQKDIMHLAQSL